MDFRTHYLKTCFFSLVVLLIGSSFSQNNALSLDGIDDYVSLGSSIYPNGVQTFTIECWVRPANLAATSTSYHAIIGFQSTGSSNATNRNPSIYMKGGELHTDLNDGTTRYDFLTSRIKLTEGKWVHLAWVKSGTTQTMYVNGYRMYSRSAPTNVSIYGNFKIGEVDNNWDGDIDEVRFWSTAKTQEEIIANMNRSLSGSETGLEAYYPFDEGTGTTTDNKATKNTSNSYDGTLTNGPVWTSGFTATTAYNALDFDGVNDNLFARINTSSTSRFTIEANVYLKAYNASANQNILSIFSDSSSSTDRLNVFVNTSNKLAVFVRGASGSTTIANFQNFPTGRWVKVLVSYEPGAVTVYFRDMQTGFVSSFNGAFAFTGISLSGVDYMSVGSEYIPGIITSTNHSGMRIDDIRLWSKALTATEVNQNIDKIQPYGTSDILAQYDLNIGAASATNSTIGYFSCAFGNRYLTASNFALTSSSSNIIAQDSTSWAVFNWTGATSNDWTVASNWSENKVPMAFSDIVIGSNSSNVPTLQAYTGVRSLNIASGKKIDINGKTLQIHHEYPGTGVLNGSTTSKLIFGRILQNLTFYMDQTTDGTTNALSEFTVGHGGNVSVIVGNKLNLYKKFSHGFGSFNANGNLVFKSNSSGTAMAMIGDDARFSFSGNVVVESYFPAKRAFRLISSPVNSTNTIYDNWQEAGSSGSGLGTHITGNGSNGTDATGTGNASLFTFDNTNQTWGAVTSTNNSTNDKIVAGTPYRIMVRGDRTVSLSNNAPTPTNTVLRTAGTLNTSDKTTTVPSGTLANTDVLAGNPFQAPIDVNEILGSSFFNLNMKTDVMYIWDPTINTRGAYVTVSLPNGTNSSNSAAGKYLMPGQSAFFKTRNNGSASLTMALTRIADVTRNQTFREGNTESELVIQLYQKDTFVKGGTVCDAAAVSFSDAYDSEYNIDDATKAFNLDENLGLKAQNNAWYSIDKRYLPDFSDTLVLGINKYRHTDYILYIKANNYNGLTPYLIDNYNGVITSIDVKNGTAYNFAVSDEASKKEERFQIVFNDLQNTENLTSTAFKIIPNPNNGNFQIELPSEVGQESIIITDVLGRVIPFKAHEVSTRRFAINANSQLPAGNYLLKAQNYSMHLIVIK